MRRGQVALIAALAVAVIVIWAAVWRTVAPALADASASPSVGDGATASPSVSTSPSMVPPTPSPTPSPSPMPTPTDAPTPAPTPAPTTDLDPRVAWVEFLAHLDAIRPEAAALTDDLVSAAEDGDRAGVRDSAVAILQLADRERDWLAGHPPATCYAEAHAAAASMIDAYADVAERAIGWAESDDGLDGLNALADLIAGAGAAREALRDLAAALEGATCLG